MFGRFRKATIAARLTLAVPLMLAAALTLGFCGRAYAQDTLSTDWKLTSKVGVSLAQSSFNNAWAGDEVGTFSWIATWNSSATKVLAPWAHWKNRLLMQFGQTHQQDPDRRNWQSPSKSSDKITYRGAMDFPVGAWVEPFAALDVDSQFFTRIKGVTTKTFTPTIVTESVGVLRSFSDTDRLKLESRVGFAVKQRINRLAVDPATMDFFTRTTNDGGVEWFSAARIATEKDRAVYASELRVFKAVATNQAVDVRRYWPAVDVDWQNTLSSKVTEWLSFDLFWQVLYDKQINKTGQYKQTLGVGLTWQLL